MALTTEERRAAADALWSAQQERSPVEPLSAKWPDMDADDAYGIQLVNVGRRLVSGARLRGYKVGLTSTAMQQMLGVDEPDFGHLLDDMLVAGTLSADPLLAPRVEPEIAFVLGRPLSGPGCSAADVRRATDHVVPALEIIDSRIADWRITLVDTIADNASSAAAVLGEHRTTLGDLDLRPLAVRLAHNGKVVEQGRGSAALGDPVAAVAWLVNRLAAFEVVLDAGHVVLPGSCTRAVDVVAADEVAAEITGLGGVSIRFT
jgi:2-keto-4-pentenoate hydratase